MIQKITKFVKYHNAFAIVAVAIFAAAVSAMAASEDVRDKVLGGKIVTESGIDNSRLLAANLDNFNVNLTIDGVAEDDKNYYIDYSFNTIAVQDDIWQEVVKLEKFTVNKESLGDRDMGLYLVEEFSEVARGEMDYLRNAQKAEIERGETRIFTETAYFGLIGKVLDIKEKVLPGYDPVVVAEAPVIKPTPTPPVANPPADTTATDTTDTTDTTTTATDMATVSSQCDGDNLDLCGESDCETDGGGHWHEGACYNNNPADDSAYYQWLKSDCLSNDKFWYNDACHDDDACEEKTFYPDADGDGFGDMDLDNSVSACEQPDGYVLDNTDCDDSNSEINPDTTEICDDGIDNNCGGADDACEVSGDDPATSNPTTDDSVIPTGACDSGHLELCDTTDCETDGGGFWYGDKCNVEKESLPQKSL